MCLTAEIVLCLITWYRPRPCWGVHCYIGRVNHISFLTSKIFWILKHIRLLGCWRMGNGSVLPSRYHARNPEVIFYSFLNFHNYQITGSAQGFPPIFTNSSPTSTALVQGFINFWLWYHSHLLPDISVDSIKLKSILSRTPEVMDLFENVNLNFSLLCFKSCSDFS